ncbi:zf-DHHC-domain-containing protein [Coccomyxa subellipsoidea C-169]|uniref:S-acyltransferase n=1 Tax=Coccomyxa subellipsoidea (strain C-169) TaxID=574566 RepID=I0YWZ9_COCSC|nr:zf-DHHC-domain-containing protein [Coccomyxa subellipsoidea C-169]EIE22918.1 zf-DHHC-domain-containing protein [Coccomyxa subellipsoidea C-169]|eukprot:XP_005647462.1 zf-DHHC-domain-containing protein [Coccomyxa subellipsoidea C-169]
MILVVLFFVLLTASALLSAYAPRITHDGAGTAAASLLAFALFFFLVVMLTWSYFACVLLEPGKVPQGWSPFETDEADRLESGSHRQDKGLTGTGRPRYCRKCQAWKPERAHHDSMLGRCVLRMDHYCVWVANSVGLLNYKAFLLFLFYTFLACLLGASMLLGDVARFFKGIDAASPDNAGRFALTMIAFVVDLAFSLSLGGLLAMHARMVWLNYTTIEMFEKQRAAQWPYDRGARRNFEEVFGTRFWRWWVPTYTAAEKARMLDATLNGHPSSTATEFAAL